MQEKTSKGTVKGSLLLQYFQSGLNIFQIVFLITMLGIAQSSASVNDWFISFWTNVEESRVNTILEVDANFFNTTAPNGTTLEDQTFSKAASIMSNLTLNDQPWYMTYSSNSYLIFYAAILAFCLVSTMTRSILYYKFVMKCAVSLHAMLYQGVTSTYMKFFDQNPSGRILNRFSKDIGTVDEVLPMMLFASSRVRK